MKDTALEALSGQDRKEVFDGVELGCGCRREMERPIGMSFQPGQDFGMCVGGVVVQDDMHVLARLDLLVDRVESLSEKFMRHFIGLRSTADEKPSAARC